MAVRYYDKVHVRAANTPVSSVAKSSLASEWGVLPGTAKVTQETTLKTEPDVTTPMGDGTDEVGSEAANAELQLINWSPTDLSSIRTALINQKVDILVYDSRQATKAWAIFGIQIYPTPEIGSNKEDILKLTGKERNSSEVNTALVPDTLT